MQGVYLIRRNRYQVGDYVVHKYDRQWRAAKDEEKRRGCLTTAREVVYQSEDLDRVISWCKAH